MSWYSSKPWPPKAVLTGTVQHFIEKTLTKTVYGTLPAIPDCSSTCGCKSTLKITTVSCSKWNMSKLWGLPGQLSGSDVRTCIPGWECWWSASWRSVAGSFRGHQWAGKDRATVPWKFVRALRWCTTQNIHWVPSFVGFYWPAHHQSQLCY